LGNHHGHVYLLCAHKYSRRVNGLAALAPAPIAAVKYNATYDKAILNSAARLQAHTNYTVTVEGAADTDGKAVEDEAGNPMLTDYTFTFKTGRN
jgi:Bacterial Ig-like domain